MKSEQASNEEQRSNFDNLRKVTPLSKYLAMTLFVALPFLCGWIGYTLMPEKVVEVERVVEVEGAVAVEPKSNRDLPYSIVSLLPGTTDREYHFEGDSFNVSLKHPSEIEVSDLFSNKNLSLRFFTKARDYTFYTVMSIYEKNNDYCVREELCREEVLETVSFGNEDWDYLGGKEYCDGLECWSSDHIYRKIGEDVAAYIESEYILHGETVRDNHSAWILASEILPSLEINSIK